MASFLEIRDLMMSQLGWNRRVATLGARLLTGADTWESIASCTSWVEKPLLSIEEAKMIRDFVCRR